MVEPTVPCELCGDDTPMTGTKRCDRCWELEGRICANPELAAKILAADRKATSEIAQHADAVRLGELQSCQYNDSCSVLRPYSDYEPVVVTDMEIIYELLQSILERLTALENR